MTHNSIPNHGLSRSALVLAIALPLASTAHAEQTSDTGEAMSVGILEEIIVTAQKREERLIDVPIAISVIDSRDIEAKGVTRLEDLAFSVPGLSTVDYGPGGTEFLQLRGAADLSGRPVVGRYFDEMPINVEAQGTALDLRLIDFERVEVMRGPQPTLYGDGSMGGTIRYVPAKPSLNAEPSGEVYAEGSSLNGGGTGYVANGHFDSRLGADWIGVRLAAGYEQDAGWIDRPSTGEKDINDANISTLRATVLARPSDVVELTLLWQHEHVGADNAPFAINGVTSGTVPSPNSNSYNIAEAVLRVNLGFAELVETPGYLDWTQFTQYDESSLYVPSLGLFGFPPGYVTQVAGDTDLKTRIVTNELRLVSKGTEPWSWATGFDYKDSKEDSVGIDLTAPNQLPFELLNSNYNTDDKIAAFWAELGYAFAEQWQAELGARYYHDKTNITGSDVEFGVPGVVAERGTFSSTNPRFNLSYKIDADSMLYFNAAKGFRSGGFNAAGGPPTYAPDTLWTYELGSKGLYFGRKLELEAAVYYNDWKGVQSLYTTPQGFAVISNGGLIEGVGADFGATLRPVGGLQLGVTAGWNNMDYKETPEGGTKLPGDPPDGAVRRSWSAFVDYRTPVWSGASLYGRADYQHSAAAQVTVRNSLYTTITPFPSRDLVNLRLGLAFRRYDVSLFANNLFEEKHPVIQGPFGVITENVEQRPRQVGLALRATF